MSLKSFSAYHLLLQKCYAPSVLSRRVQKCRLVSICGCTDHDTMCRISGSQTRLSDPLEEASLHSMSVGVVNSKTRCGVACCVICIGREKARRGASALVKLPLWGIWGSRRRWKSEDMVRYLDLSLPRYSTRKGRLFELSLG